MLTECVWTLQSFYKVPRNEIAEKLAALLNLSGVIAESKELLLHSLEYYGKTRADFVDCLLIARSELEGASIYTFDASDFQKLGARWREP